MQSMPRQGLPAGLTSQPDAYVAATPAGSHSSSVAIGAGLIDLCRYRQPPLPRCFSWRLFRYGIVFALIIFALMIIERVAVIPV
jgi:hypothetical protein